MYGTLGPLPETPECGCDGKHMANGGRCYECSRRQSDTSTSSSTSRSSIDSQRTSPPSKTRSQSRSVDEALQTAFRNSEQQPTIFPASFYHTPTCSRSQARDDRRSSAPPSDGSKHATESPSLGSYRESPESASFRSRSYSPMAAGFARLSLKGTHEAAEQKACIRTSDGRARIEMDAARMFAGPA